MLCKSADLLLQLLHLAAQLLNNCTPPVGKETTSGCPSPGKRPQALPAASELHLPFGAPTGWRPLWHFTAAEDVGAVLSTVASPFCELQCKFQLAASVSNSLLPIF